MFSLFSKFWKRWKFLFSPWIHHWSKKTYKTFVEIDKFKHEWIFFFIAGWVTVFSNYQNKSDLIKLRLLLVIWSNWCGMTRFTNVGNYYQYCCYNSCKYELIYSAHHDFMRKMIIKITGIDFFFFFIRGE